MMGNSCASYVRQVGRELKLPRRRKRALLDGLRLELEEQFPEGASPEILLAQVGQPGDTARSLLESIQPEVQRRYQTIRRRRVGCVIATLALLLAASVGAILYLDAHQIVRAEINIAEDTVPINYANYPNGLHASAHISGN